MKEYLRINTFRRKPSEFYHVKNKKKKVSMNKAYILHSRFGLNIKEYKSGKHVKTYISSKRNSGFGGPPPDNDEESDEDEDPDEENTDSVPTAMPPPPPKSQDFTLGKLSKLQDYVVDNFDKVLNDPRFEENLKKTDNNLSKNFRDASFILLYLTPLLSKIPKEPINNMRFGMDGPPRKRLRRTSRRGAAEGNDKRQAADAAAAASEAVQMTDAVAQLNIIIQRIDDQPKLSSEKIINYILSLDLDKKSPFHDSKHHITSISRLGGQYYNDLKTFITHVNDNYPETNNIVLKIIEAVNESKAGASGGSNVHNHNCLSAPQITPRSPHGVCEGNITTPSKLPSLTEAETTIYGIKYLEREALEPPNHLHTTGVKFGFYKRCYLCGLKWSRLPPAVDFNYYRSVDGGEPKEAEHVHAISHLAELILRISYIYFKQLEDTDGEGQPPRGPKNLTQVFLENITKFSMMFGGFGNTPATEMFMFVDSCAYCNRVKKATSLINLNVPNDSQSWSQSKIRVDTKEITNLLNLIWATQHGSSSNKITEQAFRQKWILTLDANENTARRGNLDIFATKPALVERYQAIIYRIKERTQQILNFQPILQFGKILIPVKGYGVQRVNISKLKKRFTDKEIRFIKKHI